MCIDVLPLRPDGTLSHYYGIIYQASYQIVTIRSLRAHSPGGGERMGVFVARETWRLCSYGSRPLDGPLLRHHHAYVLSSWARGRDAEDSAGGRPRWVTLVVCGGHTLWFTTPGRGDYGCPWSHLIPLDLYPEISDNATGGEPP